MRSITGPFTAAENTACPATHPAPPSPFPPAHTQSLSRQAAERETIERAACKKLKQLGNHSLPLD